MREKDIREYLIKMGLDPEEFFIWMNGQTVGLYEDETFDYYTHDVERWVECKILKKEPMWD